MPVNPGGSRGRSGADLGQWGGWDSTGSTGGASQSLARGGVGYQPPNQTPQVDPPVGGPPPVNPWSMAGALGGRGGEMPPGTTPPPASQPSFAPTSQQTAANPQAWAGTSFDPARNIMNENQGTPGGAFSTSMQGGGIGSQGTGYYGSNGPLDRSRFTPQGGAADAWYKQAFAGGNPNNISYLGFADQLGRQALEAAGGQWTNGDSVGSQINYLNSQAGKDWLKKLTTAPGGAQEPTTGGPDPSQGTGPEAPKPPAPPPANTINPSTPQGANQIMQAMLQGGFQHRDIPIQIRLMAMGVAGQNPLVNSMQGGGSLNPLMALLGIK